MEHHIGQLIEHGPSVPPFASGYSCASQVPKSAAPLSCHDMLRIIIPLAARTLGHTARSPTASQDRNLGHTCEFDSGKVFRSIHLPKKINTDKVKAEFKNGLLR